MIVELAKQGRPDIVVVTGGVIPQQDYDFLHQAGVSFVFGPGTVISKAAAEIKTKLPKLYSKDLVEILFRLPYTKRQHLIDEKIGNAKTVGNYLNTLEENGFLISVKVGKEKLYLNEQLLKILEEK